MNVTKKDLVDFINQQIEKEFSEYYFDDIDIDDIDIDSVENDVEKHLEKEIEKTLSDGTFDIIYHHSAMEFLMENDNSLKRSLNIASEYGYELEHLNSETLASLLNHRSKEEEFWDIKPHILSSINEYLEENVIIEEDENEND